MSHQKTIAWTEVTKMKVSQSGDEKRTEEPQASLYPSLTGTRDPLLDHTCWPPPYVPPLQQDTIADTAVEATAATPPANSTRSKGKPNDS